jgi:hypothetical protein
VLRNTATLPIFPYLNVEAVKFVSQLRFAGAQNLLVRDLKSAGAPVAPRRFALKSEEFRNLAAGLGVLPVFIA